MWRMCTLPDAEEVVRYKNGGPVTVYVIIEDYSGNIVGTETNKKLAREIAEEHESDILEDEPIEARKTTILTYDQRGTR